MWGRIEPHLRDFGITRVAHLTHLDRIGIPVHMAMRPAGRVLSSGSGKGTTELASRVSACMEAIEQVYWESARPAVRLETPEALARSTEAFVDPSELPVRRNAIGHAATPSAWLPLHDLVTGDAVWAPAETTCVATGDDRTRAHRNMSSSNGLASGARVIDAALSGVYEVVERDAIALATTLARPMQPPAGDVVAALLDQLRAADVDIELDDLTTDIGLPTVRAVIDGGEVGTNFVGYGTSSDGEHAAVRAITEAAQSRCIVIAGARDDIFDLERRASNRLGSTQALRSDSPGHQLAVGGSTGSTAGDLNEAIRRLQAAGLDRILIHRYTTDEDPAQVVRVVVPGLEGYPGPHTAPGRRALVHRHPEPLDA